MTTQPMILANDDDRPSTIDPLRNALSSMVYSSLIQLCGGEERADATGSCDAVVVGDISSCRSTPPRGPCSWHRLLRTMADSTVIRAKNRPWCYEIRTAPSYFSRFRGRSKDSDDGKAVTIVSSYGLRRTLRSCSELGQLLLLELEAAIQQHDPSQPTNEAVSGLWIRPSPTNGMIFVTTLSKLKELRSQGMFPCPHCPHWFRGLWWHVQKQHLHTHAQARQEQLKHDTSLAVVVYGGATTGGRGETLPAPGDAENFLAQSNDAANTGHPPEAVTHSADADAWEIVKRGDVVALKEYLSRNATFDPTSARDDKGAVLLHWAAGGGHLSVVQHLINECRCDPDATQLSRRSFGGRTALHWAARNGRLTVVEYLLRSDVGANAAAETQDGTTAFGWAAWQGHLPVLRRLHAHDPDLARSVNKFGCNAVLWAAQGTFDDPNMDVVRFLDSIGCDVFMINGNGHGLLHKSAQRGRHELAKWFVEKLAAWLMQDEATTSDDNAMMIRRHPDLVARLLGPDAEGCTPSDLAGIEDYTDLALFLAEQERHLILLHIKVTRATASEPARGYPSWLDRGAPVQVVAGSGCYHWEAWAGVGRMREAVLAFAPSDATY